MKIEGKLFEVFAFVPKPKDNVFLQWFEKDPSKGAKGAIYSFLIAEDEDSNTYISFDKTLEKFESGEFYVEVVPNLIKAISKNLKIDDSFAEDTLNFIQGIVDDEAEDIDDAPFNHIWIKKIINEWVSFNIDMGAPENRLHIRIRSNQFNEADAKILIKEPSILYDDSKLQSAVAISTFEVS